MSVKKDALEFVYSMQKSYLEDRDVDAVLLSIVQKTSWVGTGQQEICNNYEEAKEALQSEVNECGSGFTITNSNLKVEMLSEDTCIVYGECQAKSDCETKEIADLNLRMSVVCKKTDAGMKMLHIHLSKADDDQELDKYYVKQKTREDNKNLRQIVEKTTQDLKERNIELQLLLERHKVIMDQTTDIIFEWDIEQDTVAYSSNWFKKFGYEPVVYGVSRYIPKSKKVHPEDRALFANIMSDVKQGKAYLEIEVRIENISLEYLWCRIRVTTQFDCENRPVKAVGIIIDITEEKEQKTRLLEQAQCDALTRLYNKKITQTRIEEIMQESGNQNTHVLMIIDVDNFKMVNDRFGHLCGDKVLLKMSDGLRALFGPLDIIGRIGGDEFLVFVGNVTDMGMAVKKAKQIVNIFVDMPLGIEMPLACSVGIAVTPKDAEGYDELCRCADIALYCAKHNGKGEAVFYDKGLSSDAPNSFMRTMINGSCKIEYNDRFNEKLLKDTFHKLYNSINTTETINQILEMIGKTHNVSRVYVFETSEDGKCSSNTFEWCNEGITPQINNLKNLSFEKELDGFFDLYEGNDVFYCHDITVLKPNLRDILEKQGIVSMLQCLIKDEKSFKGYVGFDECITNIYWSENQIETLILAANMLSTFLVKQRLKEKVALYEAEKAISKEEEKVKGL